MGSNNIKFVVFACLLLSLLVQNEEVKNLPKLVAIVEYQPIQDQNITPSRRLYENAKRYVEIIDSIARTSQVPFLVVFPESTLDYPHGKQLEQYSTEIILGDMPVLNKKSPTFLRLLSFAAIFYRTSILLNLIQKSTLGHCSSDIIIDPSGRIIHEIMKDDRIGEEDLHQAPIPFEIPVRRYLQLGEYFNNSFIENSSIIINPTSIVSGFRFSSEKIVPRRDSDKRHYFICSNWISQLPFLTSLQVHQMWAQEYNLTIYFAGANDPDRGLGGSGIYHKNQGPILLDILPKGGSKVYIYQFENDEFSGRLLTKIKEKSVDELAEEMDEFKIESDPEIKKFSSRILDTTKSGHDLTLCYKSVDNEDFCCQFKAKIAVNKSALKAKSYIYHFVAYKGKKDYYKIFQPGGIEICAIIACQSTKLSSCGTRFKNYRKISWPLIFKELEIAANFSLKQKDGIYSASQFPNSLLSNMRPIHPNLTKWERNIYDFQVERRFKLVKEQDRIMTFGIFGRNFSIGRSLHENWLKRNNSSNNSTILCRVNLKLIFFVVFTNIVLNISCSFVVCVTILSGANAHSSKSIRICVPFLINIYLDVQV